MKINRIISNNFKSYKNIDIELNDLNFVIGGNASGKSNFVNILKFINDIIYYGLDDAILLQGGIKYLYNTSGRKNSSLNLSVEIDLSKEQKEFFDIFSSEKEFALPNLVIYSISIKPNTNNEEGYKVTNESLTIDFENIVNHNDKEDSKKSFTLKVNKDSKSIRGNFKELKNIENELLSLSYIERYFKSGGNLLNCFFKAFNIFYRYDSKIKIYNFDVDLLKSPSSIVARHELEENGSNLVNIIQQLVKNEDSKKKLNRIIKMILPFVEDINIENNVNKSVFFKVKESYNKKEFPSYMLSDGTVNILAVIIALYFQEDNEIIVLEEPERNIHPKLLNSLVNIISAVSEKKQIFITTHNPFIVKEANLEDLFLVSRDKNGISKIIKPIEDNKIKKFLETDLGIEDLFLDGILK